MKYKQLIFSVLLLFGIGSTRLCAQESVNTSGGNTSGNGGSLSFSIGQVVFQTHSGANGSSAQGVQQPYEISVVTAVKQGLGIKLDISAFPNPTNDFLILSIDHYHVNGLMYQLYDMSGKLLDQKLIVGDRTIIEMKKFVSSIYLLKILESGTGITTFKIIKK